MARRALGPLFILMALPLISSAQLLEAPEPFSLSMSPTYPKPYTAVVLTPVSGSVALASAVMTVTADGKKIYEGNAKPVTIPLGGAGILIAVNVTVRVGGASFTKTASIRPQDVALIAEPLSSAPVFYAGKPLVPLEGNVRVVTVAHLKTPGGTTIDPALLSYTWTVDTAQIASASGIGKDTLVVASPLQYRARDVHVKVQSQDGSIASGASLTLTPQEPTVRLYERDPLLGIRYEHALSDNYAVVSAEQTLYAASYSFPTTDSEPTVRWFLNGRVAQTGPFITLRPTGTGAGTASLSLAVSAGESVAATFNLPLTFGASKGGLGIFGL